MFWAMITRSRKPHGHGITGPEMLRQTFDHFIHGCMSWFVCTWARTILTKCPARIACTTVGAIPTDHAVADCAANSSVSCNVILFLALLISVLSSMYTGLEQEHVTHKQLPALPSSQPPHHPAAANVLGRRRAITLPHLGWPSSRFRLALAALSIISIARLVVNMIERAASPPPPFFFFFLSFFLRNILGGLRAM